MSFTTNDNWKSILIGVRYDEEVRQRIGWDYVPWKSLRLNVLIFGFDSMSRNMYMRKLPKTYQYLTEILNAFILKGLAILTKKISNTYVRFFLGII